MQKHPGRPLETSRGLGGEGAPRYHVAPRGLLYFYAMLSIGKRPMSGYDLMKEIEEKTGGAWRPGPGAIYPTLRRLAKQGYVRARAKSGGGPAQIAYEITPEGLSNITQAKRAMESSGERMQMMSSLFIDLMEPDDLVKFAMSSFEAQSGLVRTMVESDRSGLSGEDKLFILRQHRLSLERELAHTVASIAALGGGDRRGPESTRPARRGGGR